MHSSVKFINRSTSFYSGKKTKWWIHRWIWGKKWTMKWVNAMTLLSIHKYSITKVYGEINEGKLSPKHVTKLREYDGLKNVLTAYCGWRLCILLSIWVILKSNKAWYLWTTVQCSPDQPSLIPQGSLSDFERRQLLINLTLLSSSINITAEVGHVTVHLCFWESQIG